MTEDISFEQNCNVYFDVCIVILMLKSLRLKFRDPLDKEMSNTLK